MKKLSRLEWWSMNQWNGLAFITWYKILEQYGLDEYEIKKCGGMKNIKYWIKNLDWNDWVKKYPSGSVSDLRGLAKYQVKNMEKSGKLEMLTEEEVKDLKGGDK